MNNLLSLSAAIKKARQSDKTIGVAVKQGSFQVQQITYDKTGVSTINPVTGWLPLPECIDQLKSRAA